MYRDCATNLHPPISLFGSASCGKTATRLFCGVNPSRSLADADVDLYHMLSTPRSQAKITVKPPKIMLYKTAQTVQLATVPKLSNKLALDRNGDDGRRSLL